MLGATIHPSSTLLERALCALRESPMDGTGIATRILGLTNSPALVNDRLAVALLGSDPRVCQLQDGRWALQAVTGAAPLFSDLAYAVVDVETTGTGRGPGDRITEVAVMVVDGTREEMVLDTLVNPGRPISPIASRITGITDAMVRGAPPFEEIVDEVRAALAGRVFVAHNVRFDWGALNAELKRTQDLTLSGPRLCTVRLGRRFVPGLPSYGLDTMTSYFGWENPARHRAGGDAQVTALLFRRLLELALSAGLRTLAELETEARKGRRRTRARAKPAPRRSA